MVRNAAGTGRHAVTPDQFFRFTREPATVREVQTAQNRWPIRRLLFAGALGDLFRIEVNDRIVFEGNVLGDFEIDVLADTGADCRWIGTAKSVSTRNYHKDSWELVWKTQT